MNYSAVSSSPSLREKLANGIVSVMKPLYFLLRSNRKAWKISQDELAEFPRNSLGRDLYNFLHQNNLKLMPQAEFHDVYHVLLGYSTSMKDETCIQFVPLGNGAYTAPMLASTLVSLIFYPENWGEYYRAFQRGRRARRFYDWEFEKLLQIPTTQLQEIIFGTADSVPDEAFF